MQQIIDNTNPNRPCALKALQRPPSRYCIDVLLAHSELKQFSHFWGHQPNPMSLVGGSGWIDDRQMQCNK